MTGPFSRPEPPSSCRRALLAAVLFFGAVGMPLGEARASAAPQGPDTDVLLAIKGRLRAFETLQGRFEQEKKLLKIKKPLKSRGRFALQRGQGVLWRTEAPIQSLLAMTRDEVRVVKDEKTVMSLALSDQPGLRLMGKIVFAVFAADVESIRRSFGVVSGEAKADAPWSVVLAPRDAAVAKVIRTISLRGSAHVDVLEITEQNGDSTLIRFADLDDARPLDSGDARVLGAGQEKTPAR